MSRRRNPNRRSPESSPFANRVFGRDLGVGSHKTRQLCRQVEETLHYCLSDGPDGEELCHFMVYAVEPAPDASRLLVTVATDSEQDVVTNLALLAENEGRLRTEIAQTISRRRVPRLSFRIVPMRVVQDLNALDE